MEDTIETSLRSVLDQLTEDFEVVVVDDASTDSSVAILEKLANEFEILRVEVLPPDKKRTLGETRNRSVAHARGEYVILHIDADDYWEPYIRDFVSVFHRIERCLEGDVLLSGQQINMGKKAFLVQYGPYRNLPRAQDIDLWWRLAADGAYQPIDHKVFRQRLSRPAEKTIWKEVKDTIDRMSFDMRVHRRPLRYTWNCFANVFNRTDVFSLKQRILRAIVVAPIFAKYGRKNRLPMPTTLPYYRDFKRHRESIRGTCTEILSRNGCPASLDFLRAEAHKIFRAAE